MIFLVTGGAGFIGSNIVEELLRQRHSVRVFDNFSTGRRENLAPFLKDIELIEGDIRSLDALRKACGQGEAKGREDDSISNSQFPISNFQSSGASTSTSTCSAVDVVLHQAALPSVPRSIQDPITTHEVNATGTLNVLIAARDCGVKRVVYASSSSVYGDSEELPKHEGMIPNPLSPYAASKLAGEQYCRVFSRVYGLETVALRYFNVFGPRQDPNSQYAAVIPKFIAAIRKGERPTIYGDGEQSRDFTPVENVVAANIAAATLRQDPSISNFQFPISNFRSSPPSPSTSASFLVCNVAAGQRFTLNQLVSELCRLLGTQVEPLYAPPRTGDVRHSLASIGVLSEKLGITDRVTFQQGLARLVKLTGAERGTKD